MHDGDLNRKEIYKKREYMCMYEHPRASQMVLVVKNPPANAGDIRPAGSIPG